MKTAVIVGGGIAGLYSAMLLKKKYEKVYLIEQEMQVGGLLRSFQNEFGDWFDYGTHFIAGTNVEAIDKVILNEEWTRDWFCYENERGGNFFKGKLSENCLFVNAKNIGDKYYQGLSEFMEILSNDRGYMNAEEQLEGIFGYTFAHEIYIPALCKLFCVTSLKDITVDAHLRFGMKRLRILNEEATVALKAIASYDDRISHHKFSIGSAARYQYYPKDGGAGDWIEKFEELLHSSGVHILCGKSVKNIEHQNAIISAVELDNGERIQCDSLTWTIPLAFLFRAANVYCEAKRPELINTTLFHYVLDLPPTTKSHFFFCYDPNFLPFRVTLYSNLQPEQAVKTGRHRITVEVLSDHSLDTGIVIKNVLSELREMKIVEQEAICLSESSTVISQGFPVLNEPFAKASKLQYNLAINSFKNLYLEGKNNTKDWFMSDVFRSVYNDFG